MFSYVLYTAIVIVTYMLAARAEKREQSNSSRRISGLVWLIVLIFAVISGLRGVQVGTDTKNYTNLFLLYGVSNAVEIGFTYFVGFLMKLWYNPQFVFMIIALIINVCFVWGFWHFRKFVSFRYSILVYSILIYFATFSGVRQYLAVSVIFFAAPLLFKKKLRCYFAYGVVCVLMTLIHSSAFLALLLIPIAIFSSISTSRRVKIRDLALVGVCVLAVLVVAPFVATQLLDNYANYLDASLINVNLGIMVFVKTGVVLSMAAIYFLKGNELTLELGAEQKQMLSACILTDVMYQICCFAGYFYNNVARVGWYFLPFSVMMYAFILKRMQRRTYFMQAWIVVLILVYTYLSMMIFDGNRIIPYSIM